MANKRMYFYTVAIIFISIATLVLLDEWSARSTENNLAATQSQSMMGRSMGNMMASMYLKSITLSDLLFIQQRTQSKLSVHQGSQGKQDISAHEHHGTSEEANAAFIPRVLTGTIIVLLPFIVAGAIFLSIIWFH